MIDPPVVAVDPVAVDPVAVDPVAVGPVAVDPLLRNIPEGDPVAAAGPSFIQRARERLSRHAGYLVDRLLGTKAECSYVGLAMAIDLALEPLGLTPVLRRFRSKSNPA